MENQNHESKFEVTPEIESLNIADLDLLYQKLEEEDAELYSGGVGIYGGECSVAAQYCPALTKCDKNSDSCRHLTSCGTNNYHDDKCPTKSNECISLRDCGTNGPGWESMSGMQI